MKKHLKIVALCVIAASVFALAGCRGGSHSVVIDISTPEPAATSPVVDVPTDVPDFTPEPTEEPTEVPTEAPTPEPTPEATPEPTGEGTEPAGQETPKPTNKPTDKPTTAPTNKPGKPDQSVFDDAVFIGNCEFEGLYQFGVITHGKFYAKVGLNINSVYTDHVNGSTIPIIQELDHGTYGKAILLFGQNELGWPSLTAFIRKYSDFIDDVREKQPGIKVYITGLTPIGKKAEDPSKGITLANVNKVNDLLEDLAERRGAVFIEAPAEMYAPNGYLVDGASSDGIHLNLAYDRIWADHMTLKVMGLI